jgi:hypothetical protein
VNNPKPTATAPAGLGEASSLSELIEDCADIPRTLRSSAPALPIPRNAVSWDVDECCLAQVEDLDAYP